MALNTHRQRRVKERTSVQFKLYPLSYWIEHIKKNNNIPENCKYVRTPRIKNLIK